MTVDRSKCMSTDEVQQLRAETETRAIIDLKAGRVGGVNAWAVIDLTLSTGLRVSEISALTIEDIDLNRNLLSVTRKKRRTKCKESLAINGELAQHLRDYIAWTSREQGPLFVGSRGPLSAQGLQRIWKAAIKRACLHKTISIHSARHTIAIDLLKKTGNLKQVQRQLGHVSPSTTANMYADISFEDVQADVQEIRLVQGQVGHASPRTTAIHAINYLGRKQKTEGIKTRRVTQDLSQAKNNSARCDACNNVLYGQGRKIDSGQILCSDCLKYFR